MLDKSQIKNIVKTIMEAKERPIVGAAKAAARQKEVTQKVRSYQDEKLNTMSPGATEKSREKVKQVLLDAHKQLRSIFDSEATPHEVAALDTQHRLTSHLERAIAAIEKKK